MIPGTALEYDLRWGQMQKDMRVFFAQSKVEAVRKMAKDLARDFAEAVVKETQKIIGSESIITGRLAAGFGIYNEDYIVQRYQMSEGGPDDAIFEEHTRGNLYFFTVGTRVPYAEAIFEGFTVSEPRVIFLPEEGRFITVQPFSFRGIHPLERAELNVRTNGTLKRIQTRRMKKFEKEEWAQGNARIIPF